MSDQATRRAALRKRQAEREARVAQRIRLARLHELAPDSDVAERLAIEAIKAEPDGLEASRLPPAVLERLIDRNLVALFRGRVVERGRHV